MPFVLHPSVTLAWCFEDEATPQTDAVLELLADDSAMVPALWELEVTNVLVLAEQRGRLTELQSAHFVALLSQLPIHIDTAGVDAGAILAAGRHHAITAYDATYLLLAQREGIPLASMDGKLRLAAQTGAVQLLPVLSTAPHSAQSRQANA